MKTMQTERLLLRRWEESDAEDLFRYARDPDVGPVCGWPPHQDVEESLSVIRNVLSGPECYAVCLKEDRKAIGCIELLRNLVLPRLQTSLTFLPIELGVNTFLYIYLVLLLAGLVIGLLGSAFAMRRYLKV